MYDWIVWINWTADISMCSLNREWIACTTTIYTSILTEKVHAIKFAQISACRRWNFTAKSKFCAHSMRVLMLTMICLRGREGRKRQAICRQPLTFRWFAGVKQTVEKGGKTRRQTLYARAQYVSGKALWCSTQYVHKSTQIVWRCAR